MFVAYISVLMWTFKLGFWTRKARVNPWRCRHFLELLLIFSSRANAISEFLVWFWTFHFYFYFTHFVLTFGNRFLFWESEIKLMQFVWFSLFSFWIELFCFLLLTIFNQRNSRIKDENLVIYIYIYSKFVTDYMLIKIINF